MARVTKARRGRVGQRATSVEPEAPTPAERRAAMTWAQRLKRVFGIDIETCRAYGGAVRIIASIENPQLIEKILTHLDAQATAPETPPAAALSRAAPDPLVRLMDWARPAAG